MRAWVPRDHLGLTIDIDVKPMRRHQRWQRARHNRVDNMREAGPALGQIPRHRRLQACDGAIGIVVTTVAGMGKKREGAGGDGGPATKAEMSRPHGICVGADGALFIGDTLNHRVRRVK